MANEIQYDCEGCGAPLSFAPGTEALTCEYCGQYQEIVQPAEQESSVREIDFLATLEERRTGGSTAAGSGTAGELMEGGHELRCEDCGSQFVLAGQAGHCPYCDAPVVAEVEPDGHRLLPESVLPFGIEQEAARESFHRWVRGLWFAPNDLSARARASQIDGIYMPYWTYDSKTTNHYSGSRGEYYYVTRTYRDSEGKVSRRQVRKTRWYPAGGVVQVVFDDVLVNASKSLPPNLVQGLEPWDLGDLRPYDPAYLSGFIAERYAIELEPGFELAEARMKPAIRRAVHRDIGGDEQRIHSLEIHHDDITFKHCLLPLWISSFRYKDEVYRFLVNARTGEVAGERPYSAIKIALAVIAALLVILAFFVLTSGQGG